MAMEFRELADNVTSRSHRWWRYSFCI